MTEWEKIVYTSCLTLLFAVAVQLVLKFFIEPAQELRKAIANVRFVLAIHAPTIHTPIGRNEKNCRKARAALMEASCDLLAKLHGLPSYCALAWAYSAVLPPKKWIVNAASVLRGLSTHLYPDNPDVSDISDPSEAQRAYASRRAAAYQKALGELDHLRSRVERVEKDLGLEPLV